ERAAREQCDRAGAVIGAVVAVDARRAAELGDDRHDSLAPRRAHVLLDRRDGAVERAEQRCKAAALRTFVDMRVPAIEGQRADARPVGTREELRRRARRLGEIGAYLRTLALRRLLSLG